MELNSITRDQVAAKRAARYNKTHERTSVDASGNKTITAAGFAYYAKHPVRYAEWQARQPKVTQKFNDQTDAQFRRYHSAQARRDRDH